MGNPIAPYPANPRGSIHNATFDAIIGLLRFYSRRNTPSGNEPLFQKSGHFIDADIALRDNPRHTDEQVDLAFEFSILYRYSRVSQSIGVSPPLGAQGIEPTGYDHRRWLTGQI